MPRRVAVLTADGVPLTAGTLARLRRALDRAKGALRRVRPGKRAR